MTGSTRRPSNSGRIPRIHWLIATRFQAAVPVSHEFFASPWVGASRPGDHLGVDIRLAAMDLGDRLASRRVDPQVVVERAVAVAGDRLADHQPRVRVAEDPGVLLVAGRVGRDLAELDVVPRVGRLEEGDPVRRREPVADRGERRSRSGRRRGRHPPSPSGPGARRRCGPRRSRRTRRARRRGRTPAGTRRRPSRGPRSRRSSPPPRHGSARPRRRRRAGRRAPPPRRPQARTARR